MVIGVLYVPFRTCRLVMVTDPFSSQFAHGEHELRTKNNVSRKHKTELCKSLLEFGICPYGVRCDFNHVASSEYFRHNVLYPANEHFVLGPSKDGRRLPYFESLTSPMGSLRGFLRGSARQQQRMQEALLLPTVEPPLLNLYQIMQADQAHVDLGTPINGH